MCDNKNSSTDCRNIAGRSTNSSQVGQARNVPAPKRPAGPSYLRCIQTQTFCRNLCPNCQCKLETLKSVDVCTQVRPRKQMPACSSHDMTIVARTLEGHYCILHQMMGALRQQHAESMSGQQNIIAVIQNVVDGMEKSSSPNKDGKTVDLDRKLMFKSVSSHSSADSQESAALKMLSSVAQSRTDSLNPSVSQPCADRCDNCNDTVNVLLAEISDLRRTRDMLLKVRNEANDIMDAVICAALISFKDRLENSVAYTPPETEDSNIKEPLEEAAEMDE